MPTWIGARCLVALNSDGKALNDFGLVASNWYSGRNQQQTPATTTNPNYAWTRNLPGNKLRDHQVGKSLIASLRGERTDDPEAPMANLTLTKYNSRSCDQWH